MFPIYLISQTYSLIPLSKGMYTIIDAEDYEKVSAYKWCYSKGYAVCGNPKLRLHRFIMDTPSHLVADHKNHNTLDNRKSNLRNCTQRQDTWNSRKLNKGYSIFKGVSKVTNASTYSVNLVYNGKRVHIGHFHNEKAAANAYNQKAIELFGEFAHLNPVNTNEVEYEVIELRPKLVSDTSSPRIFGAPFYK